MNILAKMLDNRNLVVKKIFSLVCVGLMQVTASFAQAADLFADFFPNQRQVYQSQAKVEDYRLALSQLKKINNNWVVDREELVSGDIFRRTIELDSHHYLKDVVASVDHYFSEKNATELYRCGGLDCGSSNAWANQYFQIKQLYGLDPSQAYRVWVVSLGEQRYYVSSYIVERGNKRIYLQLDILKPSGVSKNTYLAPDPESVLYTLEKNKFYEIPKDISAQGFVTNEEWLKPIASALQRNFSLKVYVVGHDFTQASLEQQQQQSLAYAQSVMALLVKLGVPTRKLKAEGIGGLAPHISGQQSSVYIVVDNTR